MRHLIIVTIYNKPILTKKCIEILAKATDLKNNFLFLIDDYSDTKTMNLLKNFQKNYPEILLYHNNKNIGKSRSINYVLKQFPKMDYYTIIDNDY